MVMKHGHEGPKTFSELVSPYPYTLLINTEPKFFSGYFRFQHGAIKNKTIKNLRNLYNALPLNYKIKRNFSHVNFDNKTQVNSAIISLQRAFYNNHQKRLANHKKSMS